ncbi:unnamed protein product [Anisakis simplex]|uniref:PAQR3 n=1 Tax=Anisakis simplex TaxID=6269 RepID=A0A0M3J9M2_ANISI|nr:unnamed protein product [Anisakis simplex]
MLVEQQHYESVLQICMFLSAAYHMFGCASADERRRWLRFDQCGISAGLISIYLSGIYTAFQCFENWRTNYITVALGLFAFVLYIPSRSGIMDSKLFGTRVGYLHLIYMCVALFGMLPTVHWFSLHGGFENPHVVVGCIVRMTCSYEKCT